MNNSNNILDNNTTPQPQNNNINGINQAQNVNSAYEINPTSITNLQNENSQLNQNVQNIQPVQPQNNINTQMKNTISNNSINPATANPLPNNNINTQTNIEPNQSINNIPQQQNVTNFNQVNDDDLLKSFIGNNYEKITTQSFNIAGFFFTTFYMFYRKMFVYSLIVFLLNLVVLNVINNFVVTIAFSVIVGLFVNKVYLFYAKKKIAKIKANNSQKSQEELKNICATKGGTSVGNIFLGFIAEIGIAFVVLSVMMLVGIGSTFGKFFNFNNKGITTTENGSEDGTLVENVSVAGYSCINSECTISIEDSTGASTDYVLGVKSDLFNDLGDYKDYIKLNIYYNQKGSDKIIVGYKIFLKSNNEDITGVKTENELRDKIGLYSIGTHTDTFTLTEIGSVGFGYKDDKSYTYTEYTFVDSKNIEYVMQYINDNGTLNLTKGNKYNVTFEVSEGTFGYDFTIKNVK